MRLISIKNIQKSYQVSGSKLKVLNGINLMFNKGELVVIVGPSGSGKTTLLNILGGIDKADYGSILIDEEDIASFSDRQLQEYRKNNIGFVFQFYNLIQNLTVFENVDIIARQSNKSKDETLRVLEQVGLSNRLNNFPAQLSGGEQQRVAIARAIVKKPKLLLCDEPTGALDFVTGRNVLALLQSLTHYGLTVVIITHNCAVMDIADRAVFIREGKINSLSRNFEPLEAKYLQW